MERIEGPSSPSEGEADRSRARFWRRLARAVLAHAGIGVVLLCAGLVLFSLSARAEDGHDIALTTSRLGTVLQDLHATESDINAGLALSSGGVRIRRDVDKANQLTSLLSAKDSIAHDVVAEYAELRTALTLELDMLLRGETSAADDLDRARVDPASDRLNVAMDLAISRAEARAVSAARWLRNGSALVLVAAGALLGLMGRGRRRHMVRTAALAERARVLEGSARRFRALINNGDDIIILTDGNAVVHEMSDSVNHVLGVSAQPRVGRKVTDLVHPDEVTAAEAEFARTLSTGTVGPSEWRCRDGDGGWRNIEVTWTNLLDDPDVGAVVLNVRDITERHRFEEELRHRAFHDSLTGLANRALLRDRITHAMAGREHCKAALIVLDLDGFKHLNDNLGHPAGDHALVVVADRLLAMSRPRDTIARLGGDEFAILVEDPLSRDELLTIGRRLIETISQPFDWNNHTVIVGASIGIAVVQGGVHNADDLVRNADVGMYAAKEAGRGLVCTFDADLFDAAQARFELEGDLRSAVDNDELVLQYQPIVALENGHPTGFEALVRWQHPTRGMLRPDEFIPIAEETGLIVPLGRWVLNRACRDLMTWTHAHANAEALYVSVNLSTRQLEDAHIVSDVQAALRDASLDPGRLILEITETALMHDTHAALARLTALKALGIGLSVDDFGTGYSSLSYLRQFPIDVVKIDKSFIDNIAVGADNASFVGAILRLGEALHLDTLAEGIETQDQVNALRDLGCHLGQGYHYARPLDPTAIEQLLETAAERVHAAEALR